MREEVETETTDLSFVIRSVKKAKSICARMSEKLAEVKQKGTEENSMVPAMLATNSVFSVRIEKVLWSNSCTENFKTMHSSAEEISCCTAAQEECRKGDVPKSTNLLAELSQ